MVMHAKKSASQQPLLTWEACLVEGSDWLGAARSPDGDLLLPAKFFYIILRHNTWQRQ